MSWPTNRSARPLGRAAAVSRRPAALPPATRPGCPAARRWAGKQRRERRPVNDGQVDLGGQHEPDHGVVARGEEHMEGDDIHDDGREQGEGDGYKPSRSKAPATTSVALSKGKK